MKNFPITEQLYLKSKPIDKLKICEGLDLMTNEHENAAEAVRENLPIIKTVEQIIYLLKKQKVKINLCRSGHIWTYRTSRWS